MLNELQPARRQERILQSYDRQRNSPRFLSAEDRAGVVMSAKPEAPSADPRKQIAASKGGRRSTSSIKEAVREGAGVGLASSQQATSNSVAEWNFSSAIKIFHLGHSRPAPFGGTSFLPMPPGNPVPGYVCQAARILLNVSQAWLWERAKVSRKTINDFENGFSSPKLLLNHRIRRALEEAGAQFVFGEDLVGVVVYSSKSDAAQRARSDKLRGNDSSAR
ncbi:helix-turn-helix transcriptional regulator [Bosea vaviloviae]|uniref:helix-turn-helix transcriptional regulator n=1 Tax=Bosea vaviloviae TaxID=1526658 RepID=UPI000B199072|nr:hypothetical protein [Bosea vaviloviae]